MAEIILHESILALGTEGYFFGDNNLDVRYPHWPGYQSGVSIGIGFDIGASSVSVEQLQLIFSTIGVPDVMINELAKTVYITGEPANLKLNELKLRDKVRLTQQQALDIMLIVKQRSSSYVKKGFPASYSTMHPAIIEALNKISYGAPALITGWSSQKFNGLGPLYDAQMAKISDHIRQCDLFLEMMKGLKDHDWVSDSVRDIHGNRTSKGMSFFISKIKDYLVKGDKITLRKGPINVDDLLNPNNQTLEFSVEVSNNTHAGGYDINYLREGINKARKKEFADMSKLCSKIGAALPALKETLLDNDKLFVCFQSLGSGVDLNLLKAQEQLVRLGYYKKAGISGEIANVDGKQGSNTAAALSLFQRENNLKPIGTLDTQTKELLMSFKVPAKSNSENISDKTDDKKENVEDFIENLEKTSDKSDKIKYLSDFMSAYKTGKGQISDSVGQGGKNIGKDVAVIKGLLSNNGYYQLELIQSALNLFSISGFEQGGTDLDNAILQFQKDKKLTFQDGRVDKDGETLRYLNVNSASQSDTENEKNNSTEPNLNHSSEIAESNEQLKKIQMILIKEGFLSPTYFSKKANKVVSAADGIWGDLSLKAMYDFQIKYNLKADGKPNTTTLEYLKKNYGKSKNEEVIVSEAVPGSGFYPCFN